MRPFRLPLRLRPSGIAAACLSVCLAGCAPRFPPTPTPGAALDATRFPRIDTAIGDAVSAHRIDSAVFHLERDGEEYAHPYGWLDAQPATVATVYDAGELTELLATAPAVLLLAEQGKLALDAPITRYFPECAGGGRDAITVRHLLTHKSGLPADLPEDPAAPAPWHGNVAAHALACRQFVQAAPGTAYRYSRIDGILLGQLVEKVTGTPLDAYVQAHVFAPLQLRDTGFLPLRRLEAARIAPTGADPALRGVVLDATARRMDGVSGSAGVFTTAADVARFARMLVRGGALDGVRVLGPDSVRQLGAQPGFGRIGTTGCVLWIAPEARVFHVLLSNRAETPGANLAGLERRLAALAAQAGGVR